MDCHDQPSCDQYGFRKGKSTIDAVVSIVYIVLEGLENRKHTVGVFLDLSKALDCVDYKALLDKLNSHGVWGIPLLWLKTFLSDRKPSCEQSKHIFRFN